MKPRSVQRPKKYVIPLKEHKDQAQIASDRVTAEPDVECFTFMVPKKAKLILAVVELSNAAVDNPELTVEAFSGQASVVKNFALKPGKNELFSGEVILEAGDRFSAKMNCQAELWYSLLYKVR